MLEFHFYLWVAALVSFFGLVLYAFVQNHKTTIRDRKMWMEKFSCEGLDVKQIGDLSRDDGVWYYQNKNTCVGSGMTDERCPKTETYCAGGDTYGTPKQQAYEVMRAIHAGGVHPLCPLVYKGSA
jgi:hypothetical protein